MLNNKKYKFIIIFFIISNITVLKLFPKNRNIKHTLIYKPGNKIKIPFIIKGQHIILIKVKINNNGSEHVIFDTAGQTLFDYSLANKYKIKTKKIVKKVYLAKIKKIKVGDFEINNKSFFLIDLNHKFNLIGKTIGSNLKGIIGADFFSDYRLTIDYQNKQLLITKPKGELNLKQDKIHILKMEILPPYHPSVLLKFSNNLFLNGRIDTGFMYGIALPINIIKRMNKNQQDKMIKSRGSFSIFAGTKIKYNYLYKFRKIIIGDIVLKNQPVIFAEFPENVKNNSALLGKCFLESYKPTLDFKNKMVFFTEANKNEYSLLYSSGLNIVKESDGKVFVKGIWENSPADKKGIEVGDIIIAINGISTKYLDNKTIFNLLTKKKIKTIKLEVKKRNGDRIKVILKKTNLL